MTKTLGSILILLIAIFSFFCGVKYSNVVMERADWMFENNGDEVELPDLSDTQNLEISAPVDESGAVIDQTTPPAEDQNIVPSVEENLDSSDNKDITP